MAEQLQAYAITAPGFYGLNTQDSSLDLASGFALTAVNCVIDQYGRIGARKGWSPSHTANTDLTGYDVKAIGEVVTTSGTSYTICAGHNKIFKLAGSTLTTLTYGGGGSAPTITDSNWSMASLNGKLFMFQLSHDPLVFDPSVSTTTYRRVSELTGYSGTVQSSNVAISAYGRLWTANTATDKVTVQWCDIKNGAAWTSGTSGTLDVTTVWPQGGDNIVALGAHNGFLYIFGSNSILIYSGATSPSTMTLYDTVVGIGCIARDSVCSTGTDIIFLSSTGVRSLQRTIQEKSAPLRDVSKNVRNDLMQEVSGELTSGIKAVFSPREAFYVLALPVAKVAYCFDTKTALQDGAARVTKWTTTSFFTSFLYRQDGSLLIGKTSYVGLYTGYQDNGSSYRFQYYTNNTDLGTPSVTSILKRLAVVVIGGSNQILTMKWGYDFSTNYYSENVNIPSQGVAYYGVAEYNSTAEYSSGISLQTLRSYPTGSGKIVQVGFEADINGSALSIQKIEIHAKEGKIA